MSHQCEKELVKAGISLAILHVCRNILLLAQNIKRVVCEIADLDPSFGDNLVDFLLCIFVGL